MIRNYLNLRAGYMAPVTLHCSYGDSGEKVTFYIFDGGEPFSLFGTVVSIHGTRKDGANFGPFPCEISEHSVSFDLQPEMTAIEGSSIAEFVITRQGTAIGTANFGIMVEKAVFPTGVTYDTDPSVYQDILRYVQLIPDAINTDFYTRINETKTILNTRINETKTILNTRIDSEESARTIQDSSLLSQINTLSTRIDSIASLSQGSTTGDAELIDARITAEGITKSSAGSAIRSQVTDVKNDIEFLVQGQENYATLATPYHGYYSGTTWNNTDGYSTPTTGYSTNNWTVLVIPVPKYGYVYFEGTNTTTNGATVVFLNSSDPTDVNSEICGCGLVGQYTKSSPLFCRTGYIGLSQYKILTNDYYLTISVLRDTDSIINLVNEQEPVLTSFIQKNGYQMLKKSDATTGQYYNINAYNRVYTGSSATAATFPEVILKSGVTYYYKNLYGYFSIIANTDWTAITRLSDTTEGYTSGQYTPTEDCVLLASVNVSGTFPNFGLSTHELPDRYVEGFYLIDSPISENMSVTVALDGSGEFTSVVDAVNYCNDNNGGDIYIKTGVYDIYSELGGLTWINSVSHDAGERQGLNLSDNVNLYGVGNVVFTFYLPDSITYDQSRCVSCINLSQSNRIENIEFRAENCRYTCHDETNGGNFHLVRYVKNCRFIHYGNASGLWEHPNVMGGGASGGSSYDWINCQFITNHYHRAFSYHTNYDEEPSHFNIDGCVAIVQEDYPGYDPVSFRCAYHGTGQTGKMIFNFKNCSGNGSIVKESETEGSNDNIEMYVNGYVDISDITPYVDNR